MMKSYALFVILFSIAYGYEHVRKEDFPEIFSPFQAETKQAVDKVEKPGKRPRFLGTSFAHSQDISHGERETRVFYDGIIAMETVVKSLGETFLFFRKITDGKKMITTVYSRPDVIVDCEISRQRDDVKTFVAEFLQKDVDDVEYHGRMHSVEVSDAASESTFLGRNATFELLEGRMLRQPYRSMLAIDSIKSDCLQVHKLKRHMKKERDLLRDHQTGDSQTHERRRNKRSPLVVPGTNWCGRGDNAATYEDLGEDAVTDRCCREHDFCPHFISGFETKYNLFNYRLNTISHCYCDESFRTCLKASGTESALMVGNVYFNVLGMECFEFRPAMVCDERSWWGRCVREKRVMMAEVLGSLAWE